MTAADYYLHVLNADRNRALMARILINTMEGKELYSVDLSELRELSQCNRIITEAFLDWRNWNKTAEMHCGEPIVSIAAS